MNNIRCSSDSRTLLLACSNAKAVELRVAGHSHRKSAHTFELPDLEQRTYTFNSIMHILEPEPQVDEDEGEGEDDEEEGDGKNGQGGSKGDNGDTSSQKKKNKKKKKEPKPVPKYLPTSEPVLDAWYGGDGTSSATLLLSVGGKEAGYVYECSWDMPEKPLVARDVRGLSAEEKKQEEQLWEEKLKKAKAAAAARKKGKVSKQASQLQLTAGGKASGSSKQQQGQQNQQQQQQQLQNQGAGKRAGSLQCTSLPLNHGLVVAGTDGRVRFIETPNFDSSWVLGMHNPAPGQVVAGQGKSSAAASDGGGEGGGGGGGGD